jgi:hypothetical protein
MNGDRLFLLKPGFTDSSGKRFFCPACATIDGMLCSEPWIRERLKVHYVNFERPRAPLDVELGPENQSCPVLILGDVPASLPDGIKARVIEGLAILDDKLDICDYIAAVYGLPYPHRN